MGSEVVVARSRISMVRSEHALPNFQRLAIERFGLLIAALAFEIGSEIVVARRRIRMVRPKHPLPYFQRLAIGWLGVPYGGLGHRD